MPKHFRRCGVDLCLGISVLAGFSTDQLSLFTTSGEEGKVAIRNVRRDAIDKIKKLEKRGVSEDTSADNQDDVQKALKKAEGEVEAAVAAREKEITTI